MYGVDRISLSADGRYVGFTVTASSQLEIHSSDQSAPASDIQENFNDSAFLNFSQTWIKNSSEAVVYDRLTGIYELENQSQDGEAG